MLEATILHIDRDLTAQEYDRLLLRVSRKKQEKIRHFHNLTDSKRALLADLLTRRLITKRTGLQNEDILFLAAESGKPYLANIPDIHFNFSHSGNYIACAVDDMPVGIDIEMIKPVNLKIASRFFAADEKAYIFDSIPEKMTASFFEIWTMKESYIKHDGRGLGIALPSFSVLDSSLTNVFFTRILSGDEAVCSLCASCNQPPVCSVLSLEALL